jgi:hypothetical protein
MKSQEQDEIASVRETAADRLPSERRENEAQFRELMAHLQTCRGTITPKRSGSGMSALNGSEDGTPDTKGGSVLIAEEMATMRRIRNT